MFKGITPFVRDTVHIMDGGTEVARLVAVWKRPDKKARAALALAMMRDGVALAAVSRRLNPSLLRDGTAMASLELGLAEAAQLEGEARDRIKANLHTIEGLADEAGQSLGYSPELLDEVLAWDEYLRPLSESLGRVIKFETVEQQEKNSLAQAGTGQSLPPEILIKQEPLPTTLNTMGLVES